MSYCLHPLQLRDKIDPTIQKTVKCGQCLSCRIEKKREKVGQQLVERKIKGACLFITLTYNPESLPYINSVPTIDRAELKEYMDKVRRYLKKVSPENKSTYLAIGEYGDTNDRPHYHINLFGSEQTLYNSACLKQLHKLWGKGLTTIEPADKGCFDYVAQYTAKKMNKVHRIDGSRDCFVSFSASPGLGYGFVDRIVGAIQNVINSSKIGMAAVELTPQSGKIQLAQAIQIVKNKDPETELTREELHSALMLGDYLMGTWRIGGKRYPMPRRLVEQIEKKLGLSREQTKWIRQEKCRVYMESAIAELKEITPDDASPIEAFVIQNHMAKKAELQLEKQRRKERTNRRVSQL